MKTYHVSRQTVNGSSITVLTTPGTPFRRSQLMAESHSSWLRRNRPSRMSHLMGNSSHASPNLKIILGGKSSSRKPKADLIEQVLTCRLGLNLSGQVYVGVLTADR